MMPFSCGLGGFFVELPICSEHFTDIRIWPDFALPIATHEGCHTVQIGNPWKAGIPHNVRCLVAIQPEPALCGIRSPQEIHEATARVDCD